MYYNKKIVDTIIDAMKYTADTYRPDFMESVSDCNENGIYQNVWAHRGQLVTNALSKINGIKVIHVKRGFFQFEAILDSDDRTLYIMISQANLDKRKHEKKVFGVSKHYLYSLLHLNKKFDKPDGQMSLFDVDDDEERKIQDIEKMLSDSADSVDRILVVPVTYQHQEPVSANIVLYDSYYHEIESVNISDKLVETDKTPKNNVVGGDTANADNHDGNKEPLVKLKKLH